MLYESYLPTERVLSLRADWIQHVIDTNCEPFLWTPAAQLPWLIRHSFDIYSFLLVTMIAGVYILGKLISTLMQAWKASIPCIADRRQKYE